MAKVRPVQIYIFLAILVAVFLPPFAKYQELRYKNKKLEDRITELKGENRRLEEEKRRLETDIVYIEKRAREKIGVVKKGEIVLKEAPEKR